MNPLRAALAYKKVQVQTSSPGDLLIMLFDGLFRFLGDAERFMAEADFGHAGERISRAHAILEELSATLNAEVAPELCANLRGVYGFAMTRLVEANISKSPEGIAEVARVLEPIRTAFKEVTSPKP